MATIIIDSLNANPPGSDIAGGESITLRNLTDAPMSLAGWALRDAASDPHRFTFPAGYQLDQHGTVEVVTGVNPGGNQSPPPGILYWGRGSAVWNNPGDIAILADGNGVEQSRFAYGTLPPGAAPFRLAVPAFWDFADGNETFWTELIAASTKVGVITVLDGGVPAAAAQNADIALRAKTKMAALSGTVLGYVSTRDNGHLRSTAEIGAAVQAWYDQFGTELVDGIYFDELVLPEYPDDVEAGIAVVKAFKQDRPGSKAMILAGQATDEAVMGEAVDWAILWEDKAQPYLDQFAARVHNDLKPVPTWWKDPGYRNKIVHIAHNCPEPARQQTISYANERNVGNIFVMDRRGLRNPADPDSDQLYDHLPPANPYWNREVIEAGSYYDFGLDPQRAIRAAHLFARSQLADDQLKYVHGWPNGEQVWLGSVHVRGTFLLRAQSGVSITPVALDDLAAVSDDPGSFAAFDVPGVWAACHRWAQAQHHCTAMPTFVPTKVLGRPAMRVAVFPAGITWLTELTVARSATTQQPSYSEVLTLLRNVNRAVAPPAMGAIPTFQQAAGEFPGIPDAFPVLTFASTAPIVWRDVTTKTYISQL